MLTFNLFHCNALKHSIDQESSCPFQTPEKKKIYTITIVIYTWILSDNNSVLEFHFPAHHGNNNIGVGCCLSCLRLSNFSVERICLVQKADFSIGKVQFYSGHLKFTKILEHSQTMNKFLSKTVIYISFYAIWTCLNKTTAKTLRWSFIMKAALSW